MNLKNGFGSMTYNDDIDIIAIRWLILGNLAINLWAHYVLGSHQITGYAGIERMAHVRPAFSIASLLPAVNV